MNKIINILKKMNKKAIKNGDIPVACIIRKENKIIAKAYNKREKCRNPLYHAEIIAIQKASKKLNRWNLSDCELIVTLKPCEMCESVIHEARIKKVKYFLNNEKKVNKTIYFEKIDSEENNYFEAELKQFFLDKR